MSWVIYLNFLSVGKFVLIEYLTFNYIFAYFWNAIWLLYKLIIHAYFEANFRENIFSANFPLVSIFQCETSGRTYSCAWTHVSQTSGWLSNMFGHARSCWVLTWQWPSTWVSYASGQVPYRFKLAFFSPCRSTSLLFSLFLFLFLAFLCGFLVLFHKFSSSFVIFYIFSTLLFLSIFLVFINY